MAPVRLGGAGMAGSLAGSAVLHDDAMRSVMTDMASPMAWCRRSTTVEVTSSEVGKSRKWNSQSGWRMSIGSVDNVELPERVAHVHRKRRQRRHVILHSLLWVRPYGTRIQHWDNDMIIHVYHRLYPPRLAVHYLCTHQREYERLVLFYNINSGFHLSLYTSGWKMLIPLRHFLYFRLI
jgi:hypothetical protein